MLEQKKRVGWDKFCYEFRAISSGRIVGRQDDPSGSHVAFHNVCIMVHPNLTEDIPTT